jgi:hypothetical protein
MSGQGIAHELDLALRVNDMWAVDLVYQLAYRITGTGPVAPTGWRQP